MLRILHVVSYFPPDRIGGVGEVVAHVHQALKAAGHQSTVLTTGASRADPSVLRISRTPNTFSIASALYASLARESDVVHIHHGDGIGLLVAMRARVIKTPVLLTMHVSVTSMRRSLGPYRLDGRTFCRDTPRRWLYRQGTMRLRSIMDGIAIKLADGLTFISRSAARDVLGMGPGDHAKVIYNSLPHAALDTLTRKSPVDLLFVGANTERKRVELLPLILLHVKKRVPNATLRIAGVNPEENRDLVQHARELGVLDSIEFVGHLRAVELGSCYRSAKVLLVPSVYEGLPMVILEAMLHDLPVVATRVSGHPEVIEDGVCGLLVPPDDPEAMADAAVRLINDKSIAASIADAGRSRLAERFSPDAQLSGYVAEYHRLLHRQP